MWAHNTHVGDARFTDMTDAGMVNLGELVRQRYGEEDTVLVGFGSHHGRVVAARAWGNYVPTVLGRRYDAFLWFDETRAVEPLEVSSPHSGELETWPFGG